MSRIEAETRAEDERQLRAFHEALKKLLSEHYPLAGQDRAQTGDTVYVLSTMIVNLLAALLRDPQAVLAAMNGNHRIMHDLATERLYGPESPYRKPK